jgi:hypothetical protein
LALGACVGEIAGGEALPQTAASPLAGPNDVTVTFNSFASSGTRVRDHGGIRWNDTAGGWVTWFDEGRERPDGMTVSINNIWVNEATATFDLPAGMVLKSLRVFSPDALSKVKISSPGNPDRVWTDIDADYRTLTLAWSQAASRVSVTVTSTGLFGVAAPNFDDIVYGPAVGGPPQVFDDPSDGIEWEPIDLATTRQLRDSFDWNDTTPLSEAPVRNVTVDGQVLGLPALHYAIFYVRDANELRELEEIGVHYDLAPLFDEEWPDTGTSLVLPFNGDPEDGHGMFAFGLMPAIVYNALRAESLAGEDTFRAVILRDVPDEADAGDGTVSWDFVAQNMASWAPPRTELTDSGESVPAIEEEGAVENKRLGKFLRRALRRVRDFSRGTMDLIRRGLGVLAKLSLPKTRIDLETTLNDRTLAPLVRGWDDGEDSTAASEPRGFGKRLTLKGVRVNVSGQSRLTLYQDKLDARGRATLFVPTGLRVNICFEADSPTAKFERGLLRPVMHCWPRHRPRGAQDTISRVVGDTEFYVMAQLTDARDYSRQVLGFTPPKATIQVGTVAELMTRGDAADAFVPCLEATNAPGSVVDAYNGLLNLIPGLGSSIEFLFATDIVLNHDTRKSRLVPVHEYGHFVFCTLLADTAPGAFDQVWSQVLWIENVDDDSSGPVKALNEGFADWFASQVVSGTDYFETSHITREQTGGEWFYDANGPGSGGGMEANVGGPVCAAQGCIDTGWWDAQSRVVGTVATILHDAVDRDTCTNLACRDEARTDGAVWDTSTTPFTAARPFTLNHISDEVIELSPYDVVDAVRTLAERSDSLSYDHFYDALRDTMRDRGYEEPEICQLFALHDFEGDCEWPNGATKRHKVDFRVQLVPAEPLLTTGFGTVRHLNDFGSTCTPDLNPTSVPVSCSVTEGASISLEAVVFTGFQFAGWSGACHFAGSTNLKIDFTNLSVPQECVANFNRASFLVTGNASGSGFVNPPVARVPFNRSVTLQATPSPGHRFVRWTGDTACVGPDPTNPTRMFVPTRDVVCVANFVPITFTVRGNVVGNGTVSPTSLTVNHGSSVTFTATPRSDSNFVNWTGSPQCAGRTIATLPISPVTSDITCTANFVRKTYTVSASATNGGTVTPTSRVVNHGDSITLVATHSTSRPFVNWTGSPQCTGPNATLTITPVTSNVSCTANFAPNPTPTNVTVTFGPSPSAGGTVTATNAPFLSCWGPSCTFAPGGSVTLTARQNTGYVFAGWSGCSTESEPVIRRTNVQSSETCTARFLPVHRVTYSANAPAVATADVRFGTACTGGVCNVIDGGGVNLTMNVTAAEYAYDGWTCTEAGTGRVVTTFGQADRQYLSILGIRANWTCRGQVSFIPQ